ncbi:MAG: RNA-binding transcriptional accessory protein, partial [Myxococcales bacterium]|nr:RNA-binding transcriptional accessory protein [Myxococcales bacterium]
MADFDPTDRVAQALKLPARGVAQVLGLLGQGNTVPFIARYRKEATGGLDEVQIRAIQEEAEAVKALEARRAYVLETIAAQGKLTDGLRRAILAAASKTELEDLYLPYKQKRRTKATVARERGLEPLAEQIRRQPAQGHPRQAAQAFVDPRREVPDVDAALEGARHICSEWIAETPAVRQAVREALWQHGRLTSKSTKEATAQRTRFEQYYD